MPAPPAETISALRSGLQRWLFPESPAAGSTLGRTEAAILVGSFLALATILQLLRLGFSEALDSLWAEDGLVILTSAEYQGFWETIFTPYAGYLILVPRLIGEVGVAVPLGETAAAVSIGSAFVVALSGFVVWIAAAAHIRNPFLRGTLAALTVLCPVAALESIATASYLPWYMLFASFWLLLWRPRSTGGAILGGSFLLAAGLSNPGLWFFAPLAALRALAARDRRDAAILAGYGIGAAVQVPVYIANGEQAEDPLWTADIWTSYLQRVVDGGLLGERLGGEAWTALGWPLLIGLTAILVVGLLFAAWRSSPTARWFLAIAVPTSLGMFVVSAYQRVVGTAMMWPPDVYFGNSGRYAIVPALLLVSAILVAIDRWPTRLPGPARLPWAGLAVIAVLLVALVSSFDVSEPEIRGTPSWPVALNEAAATCAAEDLVDAPVSISPPGFGVLAPCADIVAASDASGAR